MSFGKYGKNYFMAVLMLAIALFFSILTFDYFSLYNDILWAVIFGSVALFFGVRFLMELGETRS
ncbi:hypothetical protein LCGC14_0453970 [marine sediment metagenome]|uniref:Uncharacterized protein n=1 Tax=marine sediment metagenome TaxID=412755 RepID=A0A0F9T025_9ZZZZ|nr:hypothetical protein [bacterium]